MQGWRWYKISVSKFRMSTRDAGDDSVVVAYFYNRFVLLSVMILVDSGWEMISQGISSNIILNAGCMLQHMPKCHISSIIFVISSYRWISARKT